MTQQQDKEVPNDHASLRTTLGLGAAAGIGFWSSDAATAALEGAREELGRVKEAWDLYQQIKMRLDSVIQPFQNFEQNVKEAIASTENIFSSLSTSLENLTSNIVSASAIDKIQSPIASADEILEKLRSSDQVFGEGIFETALALSTSLDKMFRHIFVDDGFFELVGASHLDQGISAKGGQVSEYHSSEAKLGVSETLGINEFSQHGPGLNDLKQKIHSLVSPSESDPHFDSGSLTTGSSWIDIEKPRAGAHGADVCSYDSEGSVGVLSKRYETSGRGPGTISSGNGDFGGRSYGSYQFSSKTGTLRQFLNKTDYDVNSLRGLDTNTPEFDKAWKQLAIQDPIGFENAQHRFIEKTHYQPELKKLNDKLGLDVKSSSSALQNVIWSTAVQHGPRTCGIVEAAMRRLSESDHDWQDAVDHDEKLIRAIYDERGRKNDAGVLVHFVSSSSSVQRGVSARFDMEKNDALRMIEDQMNRRTA